MKNYLVRFPNPLAYGSTYLSGLGNLTIHHHASFSSHDWEFSWMDPYQCGSDFAKLQWDHIHATRFPPFWNGTGGDWKQEEQDQRRQGRGGFAWQNILSSSLCHCKDSGARMVQFRCWCSSCMHGIWYNPRLTDFHFGEGFFCEGARRQDAGCYLSAPRP